MRLRPCLIPRYLDGFGRQARPGGDPVPTGGSFVALSVLTVFSGSARRVMVHFTCRPKSGERPRRVLRGAQRRTARTARVASGAAPEQPILGTCATADPRRER